MIIVKGKSRNSGSSVPRPSARSASWLGIAFLVLLFTSLSTQAQTFTVLHVFTGLGDGEDPGAGVIQDSSGNFFGTTQRGGSFGFGTVFEINAEGKETILHSFWGGDGLFLNQASLIRDKAGNFYGTAGEGGTLEGAPPTGGCKHGCGAVFKLDKSGKSTLVYAFTGGTDGGAPWSLIRDSNGNLYGTTQGGGAFHNGTVFKIDATGKETVLDAFEGQEMAWPESVVLDKMGNLYGVTAFGGRRQCQGYGCGTMFKLDPSGKKTVLHTFTGGADGSLPQGPLVLDSAGNLYGVAYEGGDTTCWPPAGCGVVFKMDKNGKETVLHIFGHDYDGRGPSGGLLRDKAGNLYGVTTYGGSNRFGCYVSSNQGCGTVFKVDALGHETVLLSFPGLDTARYPNGSLIMDKSGNLYGTTNAGGDLNCHYGVEGCGVVFKLAP